MEFGLFLNGYLPGPAAHNRDAEHTMLMRELQYAIHADGFNWKYAWFGEHHALTEYSHMSAPEVVIPYVAAKTERTHLGRFIQSIIDGGALDIVIRKGKQNLDILLGNAPLTLLVPAALLFVIYVLARPTSWGSRALQRSFQTLPTLRAGLVALVITLTIGFLINDSGTAIPAVGATVAVPLIVAVAVSALADEARVGAPTRRDRRRR